jgi:serine/threonine-protein kinase RsbT
MISQPTTPPLKEQRFSIAGDTDVAYAALGAKNCAKQIGFSEAEQYMIATAVSELARNIYVYAKKGTIHLSSLETDRRRGIEVVAEDSGPGILDVDQAMTDSFSTGGTLGVGLPGAKRLMDEFQIDTNPDVGTKITIRKWKSR